MADILSQVQNPGPISLSSKVLGKGIDNYHIDVELGKPFVNQARGLIEDQVKRIVAGKRPIPSNAEDMERLREIYRGIIEASLHRSKTDLSPEQFLLLQFAIVKFIIQETKARMDAMVEQLEETLGQQQYAGSRNLLATQERFTWLRRHYDEFYFHACRHVMRQLHREEVNHLRPLRTQFLGSALPESVNILFNPMLSARSPGDPQLLMEYYALWPGGSEGFSQINENLETYFSKALKVLHMIPLKTKDRGQTEVYDEFGAHFGLQNYLGPSLDQLDQVEEELCWLEHPGHVRLLFDESVHQKGAAPIKEQGGIRARIAYNAEAKKMRRIAAGARKKMAQESQLKCMMASYLLRENWSPGETEIMGLERACEYIAGINRRKIAARVDQSKEGAQALLDKLDTLSKQLQKEYKEEGDAKFLRILSDWSRYRLHLKYFRFAHRIFNRINVITDPEKAQLSKSGGHLHRLVGGDEVKAASAEPQIIHHTILKADVRGSTTVTQELIRQELNPASYFSLRFFDPINQLLEVYGGIKVFIEGDAVILGFYEYDNDPLAWYSVSRACGIAKEMLDIVNSKNAHSRQTGLPLLEIGIGISYSDDKPLFLFDDNKPIMISPAIGDADRLSSCSWRLRESFKDSPFNVEVLEIDGEGIGEKGQEVVRYNVNGILLDGQAFEKLQSEITLRRLNIKTGQINETMHVGRFPDIRGKERDLIVREGRVGVWQGDQPGPGQTEGHFYEVLPNTRLASQVLEVARRQPAKSA